MAKIVWTCEANRWLKDIFDYLSVEDPLAASGVVEGIYQKSQILKEFPQIGYQYEHESEQNIRIVLYGHYRIAYEIVDTHVIYFGCVSQLNENRKLFILMPFVMANL